MQDDVLRLLRSVHCDLDRLLTDGAPMGWDADVRTLQALASTATDLVEAVRLHAEDLRHRAGRPLA